MNVAAQQVLNALHSGDSFAAAELIQRDGSPRDVAAAYHSLRGDVYWKSHDLPAAVTIGRAGIFYCLSQSLICTSPQDVDFFRSTAKSIAYDVGSFTWPGWEEPGIDPTAADLAAGRDCARLNLRLALDLQKPLDRVAMAHWLLGAHNLAAGDFDLAMMDFQSAQDALPSNDPAHESTKLCYTGYFALAKLGRNPRDTASAAAFEKAIETLESRPDEDAKTYVAQLTASRRLFLS